MDTRGPDHPTTNDRIAAFQHQIKEMRRDLRDTLTLIDKLRENCLTIEDKLATAEQEYAVLLKSG
jgi:hypothetical protein